MTPTDNTRVSASLRRYASANRGASASVLDRLLRFIGAELKFADDVLGDLAEERARRVERDGARSASWWYFREGIRSSPHLAWNAVVHGGPSGRARVAIVAGAIALIITVGTEVLRGGQPTPVRLEVDGQRMTNASDGVIVNSRRPVVLAMRALDAKGTPLKSTDIRYQWMSGAPISVTANGVITCAYAGDGLLRASLGAVARTVGIKCAPVREIRAQAWMYFALGDSSQELSFVALDPDGMPVTRLAGDLRVRDSTIATLKNGRIYPLSVGHTRVNVRIGDGEAATQISVFERVASFVGVREDQRLVIAPVRLALGDTIVWPLPRGLFLLEYHPNARYAPTPTLHVDGPVMCQPSLGQTVQSARCLVRGPGASVRLTYTNALPNEASCDICRSALVVAQRKLLGNRLAPTRYVKGALSIEQERYP
jgi:hypothetical protein